MVTSTLQSVLDLNAYVYAVNRFLGLLHISYRDNYCLSEANSTTMPTVESLTTLTSMLFIKQILVLKGECLLIWDDLSKTKGYKVDIIESEEVYK